MYRDLVVERQVDGSLVVAHLTSTGPADPDTGKLPVSCVLPGRWTALPLTIIITWLFEHLDDLLADAVVVAFPDSSSLKFAHSEYSDLGNVARLQGVVCSVVQWDDRGDVSKLVIDFAIIGPRVFARSRTAGRSGNRRVTG